MLGYMVSNLSVTSSVKSRSVFKSKLVGLDITVSFIGSYFEMILADVPKCESNIRPVKYQYSVECP